MNGPTILVIPEQKIFSCRECDFYNHSMLKSGINPIYGHFCSNPDIPEEHKKISILNCYGNLMNDKTPEWCPLLPIEQPIPKCRFCETNRHVVIESDGHHKHCKNCGNYWF